MRTEYLLIGVAIAALIALLFLYPRGTPRGDLDLFAECLAQKGMTMYGVAWCPHCENEKQAFGDSFRFVPYVECSDDPQRCLSEGITGYPTWIFENGRKLVGEQGIEVLARESSCALPDQK